MKQLDKALLRDGKMQSGHKNLPITRVVSFTSGKGGVGKSTSVMNTALALANRGRSVLILDADLGLANLDVMMGVKPSRTLFDVIEGRCSIDEVVVDGPLGVALIPASSGIERMCQLGAEDRSRVMEAVEDVALNYDYLLIDTQAGIGSDVIHFNVASNEMVVVINSEPTSLTDAYALIKVLANNYKEKRFAILVNEVSHSHEAEAVFKRFSATVERFLHVSLQYLGFIPSDSSVPESIRAQRPLMVEFPSSSAARAYVSLAEKIDGNFVEMRVKGGIQFFFRQLLEVSSGINS